jgi:hypothetical protein
MFHGLNRPIYVANTHLLGIHVRQRYRSRNEVQLQSLDRSMQGIVHDKHDKRPLPFVRGLLTEPTPASCYRKVIEVNKLWIGLHSSEFESDPCSS